MTCTVNAIPIVSQYMIAPNLQQGFIDINSGELLAAGVVTFYRDENHTQLKPIFTISGPPDDPIFTELPNPLTLSAIGTFEYMNNDIIPYYKPYDENGNVDLYYITVYNSAGALQFTRDHYPTIPATGGSSTINAENFIPNGQFLMHLNLPNNGLIDPAVGSANIAYGGWSYQENISTTSINTVKFLRYNAPIIFPDQNPRYAVEIICTSPNASDSMKDLVNVIEDVNFMQRQELTFQVTSYSNDGENHDVDFIIGKYFGSGGSPYTEEVISTFTITPQVQNFLVNFTMSSNIGSTLGTGDDDNITLRLRGPLATTSNILYTNFILVAGTFGELTYPPITPEQDKAFTLPASFDIPAYDGSNSGNAVILGTTTENMPGLGFIYMPVPPVGSIHPYVGLTAPVGYILCDGTEYSVDPNIGYSQHTNLFNLILSSSVGGTTSDGFVVTGTYSFGTGHNGFEYVATGSNTLNIYWNRFDVSQLAPNAGTSGFTFSLVQSQSAFVAGTSIRPFYGNKQIYSQTVLAGSSITPGSYYLLPVNTPSGTFTQLFWMSVDGVGTIPTSVIYNLATQIKILSTDTVSQVRDKIVKYANGIWQAPDLSYSMMSFYGSGSFSVTRYSSQTYGRPDTTFGINYSTGNQSNSIGSNIDISENTRVPTAAYPSNLSNTTASTNLLLKNFNAIIKT